jgi:hypothetical protein
MKIAQHPRNSRRCLGYGLPRSDATVAAEAVEPSVVADLHNVLSAGVAASESYTGRDGFAPGLEKADAFGAWNDLAEHLRDFAFQGMRMAVDYTVCELPADCVFNGGVPVTKGDRSQAVSIVDIFAAVGIPDSAPLAAYDHPRLVRHQPGGFGTGTAASGNNPS